MGKFYTATRTKVSHAQMRDAITSAWANLLGDTPPSSRSLLVLLAHWDMETNAGEKMYNFNVGNKKAKPNGDWGDYTFFATFERLNGMIVHFWPPDPQCCFRAYSSLADGCLDYLAGLYAHKRFKLAWPAIIAGDPIEFAHQLKLAGYYTATESSYKSAMKGRFYAIAGEGRFTTRDELVEALTSLGYKDVKSFQADNGLQIDGIAGPMTKGVLALKVDSRQ